jgi:hypothetical protein
VCPQAVKRSYFSPRRPSLHHPKVACKRPVLLARHSWGLTSPFHTSCRRTEDLGTSRTTTRPQLFSPPAPISALFSLSFAAVARCHTRSIIPNIFEPSDHQVQPTIPARSPSSFNHGVSELKLCWSSSRSTFPKLPPPKSCHSFDISLVLLNKHPESLLRHCV